MTAAPRFSLGGALRARLAVAVVRRLSLAFGLGVSLIGCFTDNAGTGGSRGAGGDAAAQDGSASASGDTSGAAGVVVIARGQGSPISPLAFGQNYWDWVDWSGNGTTAMTGTEARVAALGVNVLRAGGNNNDWAIPTVFDATQIDAFVAYCRAVGAEPILQVPLVANNVDGGAATAQAAADMVTYANVTKGYGIKYWEIGNEPDFYPTDLDGGIPIRTPAQYCTQFASYVTAMRAANANAVDGGVAMMFLGPEIGQPNVPWLTAFLDGCKDSVDIVTVHRYPFGGKATSPAGAMNDVVSFRTAVRSVAAAVAAHARPGTPFGITESNISYDYTVGSYTPASLAAAPGTFPAAMWTADVMGAALESHLWTFALWNLAETGGPNSLLGFLVDGRPVPAYYAAQMVSRNFRGQALSPSGVPVGFSVYASYDAAQGSTAVLVINKTGAASRLTLAVDALAAETLDFPGQSMTIVRIPDSPDGGTSVDRYTADLADAGMPPQAVR